MRCSPLRLVFPGQGERDCVKAASGGCGLGCCTCRIRSVMRFVHVLGRVRSHLPPTSGASPSSRYSRMAAAAAPTDRTLERPSFICVFDSLPVAPPGAARATAGLDTVSFSRVQWGRWTTPTSHITPRQSMRVPFSSASSSAPCHPRVFSGVGGGTSHVTPHRFVRVPSVSVLIDYAAVASHRVRRAPCHSLLSVPRSARVRTRACETGCVPSYGSHTRGEGQSRLPRSSLPLPFSAVCRPRPVSDLCDPESAHTPGASPPSGYSRTAVRLPQQPPLVVVHSTVSSISRGCASPPAPSPLVWLCPHEGIIGHRALCRLAQLCRRCRLSAQRRRAARAPCGSPLYRRPPCHRCPRPRGPVLVLLLRVSRTSYLPYSRCVRASLLCAPARLRSNSISRGCAPPAPSPLPASGGRLRLACSSRALRGPAGPRRTRASFRSVSLTTGATPFIRLTFVCLTCTTHRRSAQVMCMAH